MRAEALPHVHRGRLLSEHRARQRHRLALVLRYRQPVLQAGREHGPVAVARTDIVNGVVEIALFVSMLVIVEKVCLYRAVGVRQLDPAYGQRTDGFIPHVLFPEQRVSGLSDLIGTLSRVRERHLPHVPSQVFVAYGHLYASGHESVFSQSVAYVLRQLQQNQPGFVIGVEVTHARGAVADSLYVAMTRAKKMVKISAYGALSGFLA